MAYFRSMPSAATPPASPFAAEVAAIVRGAMARQSVGQVQLAMRSDISQSQLSKLLRGAKPMNLNQLEAICAALDLDARQVVSDALAWVAAGDDRALTVLQAEEGARAAMFGREQRTLQPDDLRARRERERRQLATQERAVASDPGHAPEDEPEHFGA